MTVLNSEQILRDKKTRDPDTVTALALTHKALSDVSCLSDFKNLERLDLSFNNLSSLEGLKSCVNLKWLSVVQNKLQSLKGIEGLTKLTLRSMDEIRSLGSLRALILNDNEIVLIPRLDLLKELNTLVLSRNPIREIGYSLVKVKSITKLSLSNCQLQSIDSSLKVCIELKELRLAHNDIKTLPAELARNSKVQNLDLGNNLITNWSDLKVLSSLVNLKNLNLQGNPIAEKDKLAKKVKKLVPNLQIFNARPMDKIMKNEKGDTVDDSSLNFANKLGVEKEEQIDHSMRNKNSKHYEMNQSKDGQLNNARGLDTEKKLKHKKQKTMELKEKDSVHQENSTITAKELKKKLNVRQNEVNAMDDEETPFTGTDLGKELKRKKQKTNEISKDKASDSKENTTITEKKLKGKSKKGEQNKVNVIDDGETPFLELFTAENAEYNGEKEIDDKVIQDVNMNYGLVTFPDKRKKIKSQGKGHPALELLSSPAEVGLGGPSTWNDV
ncbi:hypothetical protein F0562_022307 [Nyssa sinensis]|uniref:U2A'/phosphoprotein 32 family A C-terminal domain-containing protein n=1 Tax=Nyssa sinensis TaxID=561372 RepID=A0A5J5BMB4_9ASTE|nr:hypothetical protein F0562_022307 [Nyssa sinensis]